MRLENGNLKASVLAFNPAMRYLRRMYPDNDETTKLKQQFALALLKMPNDAYGAARTIEAHPGKASWIAMHWVFAPDVLEFMSQAQHTVGVAATLPDQDEFASIILKDAQKIDDDETRLKYYKLFADIRGYITKEGSTVNNNNLTINKVMAYPMVASADDWEATAVKQQERLLKQAQTIEYSPVAT